MLSLPKRLRHFLQNDAKALDAALRIFLRLILASLHAHCLSATALDCKLVQLATCAFIHRFGPSLNMHVRFHICVVDGVFEAIGEAGSEVKFYALANLTADAIAQVQDEAKRRIARAFVKRGLLDSIDSEVMLLARHGGASDNPPRITSPLRGVTHIQRLHQAQSLQLRASSDNSKDQLSWFADDSLLGMTQGEQSLNWTPPRAGRYLLRVVDSRGLSDSRELVVEMVE